MMRHQYTARETDAASGTITVLHLVNHLQWGGVRRHILDLKEGCAEHGVRSLVAASLPPDDPLAGARDVFDLPLYAPASTRKSFPGIVRSVRLLRRLIAHEGVHILHMHSRYATLLGAMVSRGASPARVYTAHNTFEDLRWLPWYPEHVIVPTDAGEAHFRANVRRTAGIRTHVVRHGVPIPDRPSEPEAAPRFCYAGRLSEEKGIRILGEALRLLAAQPGDFPVIDILGDGPLRPWLSRHLHEAGVPASRVHLHGYHPDPTSILRGATAVLFPSIALDAAPYITLEAMALGVPVIASDLPVLAEVVLPGRTGMRVPVGDAAALADTLRATTERPASMHALGAAARQLVIERHGRDRMCDQTIGMYRELLDSRGRT